MNNIKIQLGCLPGFTTLLTIVFITLKLCNVINWSWIWILSPIWITFGLLGILIPIIILFFYICLDKYV